MKALKKNVIAHLQSLKGSGLFAMVRSADFVLPGLEVTGLGEVAFPVNALQANALISVARKAPFGKGSETIVDTSVRSAWEIDASQLAFTNPAWTLFMHNALEQVKGDLGLEGASISTRLYKLLIYEKGDFFLKHKDSEKEKGMFGSLIIGLPSPHSGGALHISFEDAEVIAYFAEANSKHTIQYAAFYADCDHEVKPLESGYRVCLVYNLIQESAGPSIGMPSLMRVAEALAAEFRAAERRGFGGPYTVLLGHQYTPANFSKHGLKLHDRGRAEALIKAAELNGWYSKLCLVTSYLIGMPEDSGYYHPYGEGNDDAEGMVMEEVHDEDLRIEHWAADGPPALHVPELEENELIASFALNEGDPVEKESSGYMGNYGPELLYWYHYGAVMLWSPEQNAGLMAEQATEVQLQWLDYFSESKEMSPGERSAMQELILSGLQPERRGSKADFSMVAKYLLAHNMEAFLLKLNSERIRFFMERIDTPWWIKLLEGLKAADRSILMERATMHITAPVVERLISIIRASQGREQIAALGEALLLRLPDYFSALPSTKKLGIGKAALVDLISGAQHMVRDEELIQAIATQLTANMEKAYAVKVLIPVLLQSSGLPNSFATTLAAKCRTFMQNVVNNKPQPPADWRREVPTSSWHDKEWKVLKSFLESPEVQVFDYQRVQQDRKAMEHAIKSATIDLRMETIKKGSPHTLRIIKTQAAYESALEEWRQDEAMLKALEGLDSSVDQ